VEGPNEDRNKLKGGGGEGGQLKKKKKEKRPKRTRENRDGELLSKTVNNERE